MGPGEFDGPKQESSNGTAHTQNRSSAAHQPCGNFTMARRSAAVRTRESNPASYLHESTDAACGSGGLIRTVHPARNLSAFDVLRPQPLQFLQVPVSTVGTASALLPVLHCPWRHIERSQRVARDAFLYRRDSSARAKSSRPLLHKSRCRFPGGGTRR
jgi:hypothetical protein